MADEEIKYVYRIVMIGDTKVGKSNILTRFVSDSIPQASGPTIGSDFNTKVIDIDNERVRAQIWDTAGLERYRSAITVADYKKAVGALVVYDITSHETFLNAKKWADELRSNAREDIIILLVGNKLDLAKSREVSTDEAEKFAKSENMLFRETSAYDLEKIEESFKYLLKEVHQQQTGNPSPKKPVSSPQETAQIHPLNPEKQETKKSKKSRCFC